MYFEISLPDAEAENLRVRSELMARLRKLIEAQGLRFLYGGQKFPVLSN